MSCRSWAIRIVHKQLNSSPPPKSILSPHSLTPPRRVSKNSKRLLSPISSATRRARHYPRLSTRQRRRHRVTCSDPSSPTPKPTTSPHQGRADFPGGIQVTTGSESISKKPCRRRGGLGAAAVTRRCSPRPAPNSPDQMRRRQAGRTRRAVGQRHPLFIYGQPDILQRRGEVGNHQNRAP